MEFKEMIAELASLREKCADYTDKIAIQEKIIAWTPEGKRLAQLKAEYAETRAMTEDLEKQLRTAAALNFLATGDIKPHEAITVKIYMTAKYDVEKAISWAETAAPELVKRTLDKAKFERIAKDLHFDFVEFENVPRGMIASDLSDYRREL